MRFNLFNTKLPWNKQCRQVNQFTSKVLPFLYAAFQPFRIISFESREEKKNTHTANQSGGGVKDSQMFREMRKIKESSKRTRRKKNRNETEINRISNECAIFNSRFYLSLDLGHGKWHRLQAESINAPHKMANRIFSLFFF